jgi:fucose 4-O-acetylase-like acetyltransferase
VIAVIALCLLAALAVYLSRSGWSVRWLYGSFSFGALGVAWYEGVMIRAAQYTAAAAACIAVLVLVPRRLTILSWLGRHTLFPYILHGYVIKAAGAAGVYALWSREMHVLLVVLAGIALTFILSARPVRRVAAFVLSGCGVLHKMLLLRLPKTVDNALTSTAPAPFH